MNHRHRRSLASTGASHEADQQTRSALGSYCQHRYVHTLSVAFLNPGEAKSTLLTVYVVPIDRFSVNTTHAGNWSGEMWEPSFWTSTRPMESTYSPLCKPPKCRRRPVSILCP